MPQHVRHSDANNGDAQLMRNKLGLQVFGLSSLRAWWCACAHARVLGLVRPHEHAGALPHQAFGRMEGLLERAWNHPPLDKCLELVEDSTERSTRGVTERWARGFLVWRLAECTKRQRHTMADPCTTQTASWPMLQGQPWVGNTVRAWAATAAKQYRASE